MESKLKFKGSTIPYPSSTSPNPHGKLIKLPMISRTRNFHRSTSPILRESIQKDILQQQTFKHFANPGTPENQAFIRRSFNIEEPKPSNKRRPLGSQMFLKPKIKRLPKMFVMPKDNPYQEDYIDSNLVDHGIIGLIEKGYIPKDVDLSPAFSRGSPPLQSKQVVLQKATITQNPSQDKSLFITYMNQQEDTNQIHQETLQVNSPIKRKRKRKNISDKAVNMFEIAIVKGNVNYNSEVFQVLLDTFHSSLTIIKLAIQRISQLMKDHSVNLAFVDSLQLAEKCYHEIEIPSDDLLLQCLVNSEEVLAEMMRNKYYGIRGRNRAAQKVQSY